MDNTEFLLQEIEGLEKSLKEANDIIAMYKQREEQMNHNAVKTQNNHYNTTKTSTTFDPPLAVQSSQTLQQI